MTKKNTRKWGIVNVMGVVFGVLLVLGTFFLIYVLVSYNSETLEERFDRKCSSGVSFKNGEYFSCEQIKNAGLMQVYVNGGSFVTHNHKIYESGTLIEIEAGKAAGDYCLEASDSWNYYHSTRCVVFRYEYIACASGHCYLDEKKDYRKGFVAYFPTNYSWDSFQGAFGDFSPILVCGNIEPYQGHPQIRVTDLGGQIIKNPRATIRGNYTVYGYRCN